MFSKLRIQVTCELDKNIRYISAFTGLYDSLPYRERVVRLHPIPNLWWLGVEIRNWLIVLSH